MFYNSKGVMFGGNTYNIWISNVIKQDKLESSIIAINN